MAFDIDAFERETYGGAGKSAIKPVTPAFDIDAFEAEMYGKPAPKPSIPPYIAQTAIGNYYAPSGSQVAQTPPQEQGVFGDLFDAGAASFWGGLSGDAYLVEQIPWLSELGASDYLEGKAGEHHAGMSPDMQNAMRKSWASEDADGSLGLGEAWSDPYAYLNVAGSALGSLVALVATGGPAKWVAKKALSGQVKNIRKKSLKYRKKGMSVKEANNKALEDFENRGSLIGYGVAETGMVAGSVGKTVEDTIMAMTPDQLNTDQSFQQTLADTRAKYPDILPEEQFQKAQYSYAKTNSYAAMAGIAPVSYLAGTVTGKLLNDALKGVGKTRKASMAKGAVVETPTEGLQGGSEFVAEALATGEDVTTGELLNRAIPEALGGTTMGVTIGALNKPAGQPEQDVLEDPEEDLLQPEQDPLQLEQKDDPFIVFPDGTTSRRGEAEERISALEKAGKHEEAMDLRAKLYGFDLDRGDVEEDPVEIIGLLENMETPLEGETPIIFPDGSVATPTQLEQRITELEEKGDVDGAVKLRARLLGYGQQEAVPEQPPMQALPAPPPIAVAPDGTAVPPEGQYIPTTQTPEGDREVMASEAPAGVREAPVDVSRVGTAPVTQDTVETASARQRANRPPSEAPAFHEYRETEEAQTKPKGIFYVDLDKKQTRNKNMDRLRKATVQQLSQQAHLMGLPKGGGKTQLLDRIRSAQAVRDKINELGLDALDGAQASRDKINELGLDALDGYTHAELDPLLIQAGIAKKPTNKSGVISGAKSDKVRKITSFMNKGESVRSALYAKTNYQALIEQEVGEGRLVSDDKLEQAGLKEPTPVAERIASQKKKEAKELKEAKKRPIETETDKELIKLAERMDAVGKKSTGDLYRKRVGEKVTKKQLELFRKRAKEAEDRVSKKERLSHPSGVTTEDINKVVGEEEVASLPEGFIEKGLKLAKEVPEDTSLESGAITGFVAKTAQEIKTGKVTAERVSEVSEDAWRVMLGLPKKESKKSKEDAIEKEIIKEIREEVEQKRKQAEESGVDIYTADLWAMTKAQLSDFWQFNVSAEQNRIDDILTDFVDKGKLNSGSLLAYGTMHEHHRNWMDGRKPFKTRSGYPRWFESVYKNIPKRDLVHHIGEHIKALKEIETQKIPDAVKRKAEKALTPKERIAKIKKAAKKAQALKKQPASKPTEGAPEDAIPKDIKDQYQKTLDLEDKANRDTDHAAQKRGFKAALTRANKKLANMIDDHYGRDVRGQDQVSVFTAIQDGKPLPALKAQAPKKQPAFKPTEEALEAATQYISNEVEGQFGDEVVDWAEEAGRYKAKEFTKRARREGGKHWDTLSEGEKAALVHVMGEGATLKNGKAHLASLFETTMDEKLAAWETEQEAKTSYEIYQEGDLLGEFGSIEDARYEAREASVYGDVTIKHPSGKSETIKEDDLMFKKEVRKTKTGKYLGAPDWVKSPQSLAKMRRMLHALAKEGESGRLWYEQSAEKIMEVTQGNIVEAERLIQLIAIYSPQTSILPNMQHALQAYYAWKADKPIKLKDFAKADVKATAVTYGNEPWSGRKTNSFYLNLMSDIVEKASKKDLDKLHLPEDLYQEVSKAVTVDMWVARAFGYATDAVSDDKGAGKYSFSEREIQHIADDLDWKPHQAQAAIWVAIKARHEMKSVKDAAKKESMRKGHSELKPNKEGRLVWGVKSGVENEQAHRAIWLKHARKVDLDQEQLFKSAYDFADALDVQTGQLSWEARPSTKRPIMDGIHDAPAGQVLEYQVAVAKAFLDESGNDRLSEALGILSPGEFEGAGAWKSKVSAGSQRFVVVPPRPKKKTKEALAEKGASELLDVYSAARGLVLQQDGVAWHRPFYTTNVGDSNGIEFVLGKPITFEQAEKVYLEIMETMDRNDIVPIPFPEGVRFLNFSEFDSKVDTIDNVPFHKAMKKAMAVLEMGQIEMRRFGTAGNLIENKWSKSKNGEDYRQRLQDAGRWDTLRPILLDIQSNIAEISQEFSEKYGWGEHESIHFRRREGAEGTTGSRREGAQRSGLDVGADGQVRLVHWSNEAELTETDPSKYGTGIKGAEAQRRDDINAKDEWVDRTYFGLAGYSKEQGLGSHMYETTVAPEDLYDIVGDPDNFKDRAKETYPETWQRNARISAIEKHIKKAGYKGYYNDTIAAIFATQTINYTAQVAGRSTYEPSVEAEFKIAPENTGRSAGKGLPVSLVEKVARTINKTLGNLVSIEVVASKENHRVIQREIQRGRVGEDDVIKGFFLPNSKKIVLVADSLENKADLLRTLRHEIIGHLGFRQMMGPTYDNFLKQVASSTDPKVIKLWNQIIKDYEGADSLEVADEVIAHMAEENIKHPLLVKFMSMVRQWLRRMGLVSGEITSTEIKALILSSEARLSAGRAEGVMADGVLFKDSRFSLGLNKAGKEAYAQRMELISEEKRAKQTEREERKAQEALNTKFSAWLDDARKGNKNVGETMRLVKNADILDLLGINGSIQISVARLTKLVAGMGGTYPAGRVLAQLKKEGGDSRASVLQAHSIPADQFKLLPEEIGDPVAVYQEENGNYTFVTTAKEGGKPVVVVVSPNRSLPDRTIGSLVVTALGVDPQYHTSSKRKIVYYNTEKASSLAIQHQHAMKTARESTRSKVYHRSSLGAEASIRFKRQRRAQSRRSQSTVRGWVDKVINAGPLNKLPFVDEYLKIRYLTLGKIGKVDEVAQELYDALKNTSEPKVVYDFLTNRDADPKTIRNPVTRRNAVKTKKLISQIGEDLVKRGLLDEKTMLANQGEYLPRVYMKYLLGEAGFAALGKGKTPSDLGYLKKRKDIPEDVRRLILGQITDPAFLATRAVGIPMRDMAIMDWMEQVAKVKEWVYTPSIIEWKGQKVTPYWLLAEGKRVVEQADHLPEEDRAEARKIGEEMKALGEKHLPDEHDEQNVPDGYERLPKSPKYGALRGMVVRKEIYDDMVGAARIFTGDTSTAEQWLGYGGKATKYTQIWKFLKVAANPPAQIRNFVSNIILLQMSGVHFRKMPSLFARAAKDIRTKGKYYKIALKYGVTEATFASNEMYRIERELLDLEARTQGKVGWATVKNMGGKLYDVFGDAYQKIEAFGKTVKIMHEMENNKASEEKASMEAQKWLFDYSLVSPNVKYLRNAPVGIPFLTFYTKVFPRLLETAVNHPMRLAPYVALHYGMYAIVSNMFDVDDDDLDALKMALPKWLHDKGHAYLLPWKDDSGHWQAIDLGYFFPWTFFQDVGKKAAKGDIAEALTTSGFLGGPIPSIISGIMTGVDPFTEQKIIRDGDPAHVKMKSLMWWMWDMNMPTFISRVGFMGKMMEAQGLETVLTKDPKRPYQPRMSDMQAWLRLVGVNLYPIDPSISRAQNAKQMRREINDTKQRLRRRMIGVPKEERQRLMADYKTEIVFRTEQLKEYLADSKIHPNLR